MVAGGDDDLGALSVRVGQHRLEGGEVAVDVCQQGQSHARAPVVNGQPPL